MRLYKYDTTSSFRLSSSERAFSISFLRALLSVSAALEDVIPNLRADIWNTSSSPLSLEPFVLLFLWSNLISSSPASFSDLSNVKTISSSSPTISTILQPISSVTMLSVRLRLS
uniref:Uncharacterized protein n=1 Tax=Zea mays TaxID=4577 RepID=C4J1U7_MAIZE|nr:unknown [Zea mays]